MGFSTSGATAVVFIGLLVGFGILYPTVESAGERITEAESASDDRALRQQNTAVAVAGTTYDPTNDTLTVAVNNTGSTTLSADRTDLLVDGRYEVPDTFAVAGTENRTVWTPGSQLELTVAGLAVEPDRVKVVTGPGVAAFEVV
jgi:flagellar protein FlaF